jgi:hypothetical protein
MNPCSEAPPYSGRHCCQCSTPRSPQAAALGELLGGDDEEGAAEAAAGQLVDALGADGGLEQVLQGVARLGAAVRAVEAVGGGGGGEMSAVETDNMARDAEGLLAALSLAGRAVALRPALAKEVLRALPTARGTPLLLDTLFAQLQPGAFSEVKGAAAELVCDVLAMGGLEAARAVGGGAHTFPRRVASQPTDLPLRYRFRSRHKLHSGCIIPRFSIVHRPHA